MVKGDLKTHAVSKEIASKSSQHMKKTKKKQFTDKAMNVSRTSLSGNEKENNTSILPEIAGSQIETSKSETAVLTVAKRSLHFILWGVPVEFNKTAIRKVIAKASRKIEVSVIREDHKLHEETFPLIPSGKKFLLIAPSRPIASKLMEHFGGRESAGARIGLALGAGARAATLILRPLSDVSEVRLRRKHGRVIVRNLSFHATEANLIDKLGRFGPLAEVSIPKVAVAKSNKRKASASDDSDEAVGGDGASGEGNGDTKLRSRGFAFVTFICAADAALAVSRAGAGLKVCNREVAVDLCANKHAFEALKTHDAGQTHSQDEVAGEGEGEVTGEDLQDEHMGANNDEKDADDEGDTIPEDEGGEFGSDDVDETYDQNIAPDVVEDDSDGVNGEEGRSLEGDDVQEGKTVFLRNVPFDASAQDVRDAVSSFGKTLFAAIVKDKDTGLCKGSAFVKFAASRCAEECVAAASADKDAIVVRGSRCRANIAVDKDAASKLRSSALSQLLSSRVNKEGDKRNLYLANEGVVLSSKGDKSDKEGKGDAKEAEKRKRSQAEKRKKLMNPLFFVSAHRLSIRNLPRSVGDNDLKVMCLKAMTAGLKKGLVTRDDMKAYNYAHGRDYTKEDSCSVLDADKHAVKSAKVMLDLSKLRNGVPQSKRFGFVEFTEHPHALACLRELNNTSARGYMQHLPALQKELVQKLPPTDDTWTARLVAEFTVENFNKVRQLQQRAEKSTTKRGGSQSIKSSKAGDDQGEVESSGVGLGNKNEGAGLDLHGAFSVPAPRSFKKVRGDPTTSGGIDGSHLRGPVNSLSTLMPAALSATNTSENGKAPLSVSGERSASTRHKRRAADRKRREKVLKRNELKGTKKVA